MWGALKQIFATPKVVNATIKGIDASVFTREERSEFFLKWLQASSAQNLARRVIAFMVTVAWMLAVLTIFVMVIIEADVNQETEFVSSTINPPFMIIMTFYFTAHVLRAYRDNKK